MKRPQDILQAIRAEGGYIHDCGHDGLRFTLPSTTSCAAELCVIASWGGGWDHASVHAAFGQRTYTPTWDAMQRVKRLLWTPDEWAIQYHPATADYIDVHQNVLHLWRPQNAEIPTPPKEFV